MNATLAVVRFHLTQRFNYLVLPWVVLAFSFASDVVILGLTPAGHSHLRWVGGLGGICVVLFVLGVQSAARSLPFALGLGVSRRTYLLGTLLLAVGLAVGFALVITLGQAVERATDGWGLRMAYFRVPYLLDGSWALTLVTATAVLAVLYLYGTWFGLVHRRWGLLGLVACAAAQITVALVASVLVSWSHAWASVGHFLHTVNGAGAAGLLVAAACILAVAGYATIRRVSV